MKPIIIAVVIGVLIIGFFGYYYFAEAPQVTLEDAEFNDSVSYACEGEKGFSAAFGDKVVRVTFPSDQLYTLEQISMDDENGTKFANEGDQVVLWVKDESAFIEESGTTTYAACRAAF